VQTPFTHVWPTWQAGEQATPSTSTDCAPAIRGDIATPKMTMARQIPINGRCAIPPRAKF
jgi:hypothetical protein